MTFTRAVITAWLTSQYVEHPDWQSRLVVLIIAGVLWRLLTTDPLPAAIDRGLELFKERYQR